MITGTRLTCHAPGGCRISESGRAGRLLYRYFRHTSVLRSESRSNTEGMMSNESDPTSPLRMAAAALPSVTEGTSCNQTSFKTGKRSFLFVGPGRKGVGFKAMFKLEASMSEAKRLAAEDPGRFEVGSTGWVTTRFREDLPLPTDTWQRWLRESYELSCPPSSKSNK